MTSSTTSTRLPFISSSSLRSMTSFCLPSVVMDWSSTMTGSFIYSLTFLRAQT